MRHDASLCVARDTPRPPGEKLPVQALGALHEMSVFVRVRGPTTHGAVWRLGPHHAVAVVSYLSRQWGPIVYCSFPRVGGKSLTCRRQGKADYLATVQSRLSKQKVFSVFFMLWTSATDCYASPMVRHWRTRTRLPARRLRTARVLF